METLDITMIKMPIPHFAQRALSLALNIFQLSFPKALPLNRPFIVVDLFLCLHTSDTILQTRSKRVYQTMRIENFTIK